MIREYLPFLTAVVVMFDGWMLAAWFAPSPAVLAAGVFASAFVALGAGGLTARALWGEA